MARFQECGSGSGKRSDPAIGAVAWEPEMHSCGTGLASMGRRRKSLKQSLKFSQSLALNLTDFGAEKMLIRGQRRKQKHAPTRLPARLVNDFPSPKSGLLISSVRDSISLKLEYLARVRMIQAESQTLNARMPSVPWAKAK